MRIAIIGANSFIARNMIYLIDREYPEAELFLYDYGEEQADGHAGYSRLDVMSMESLQQVNWDVDAVFVFVGKTGTLNGFEEYRTFISINEIALLNMLTEYRRQGSTAKLIFPSTRLVYKGSEELLSEDAEKEFKTVYAINKFACETYLRQYHELYGVNYCAVRICVPYGSMIPNASSYGTAGFMIKKAAAGENISLYGDGLQRRTFTHMEDLCSILMEIACNEACAGDVYNIGGEDYSLKAVAEYVASLYNVGVDYVEWPEESARIESGSTVFNDSKLQALIGHKWKNSLKDWVRNER